MPTERLRSRDGENQQSDGRHRPSSSSQRTFDLSRINAERNYANSVQSGENRGKRERNPKTERSINERGKLIENQIPLATNYGQDNPGLKGGMDRGEISEVRGQNIKALVDKVRATWSNSGHFPENWPPTDIRKRIIDNKMNYQEYRYAEQFVTDVGYAKACVLDILRRRYSLPGVSETLDVVEAVELEPPHPR